MLEQCGLCSVERKGCFVIVVLLSVIHSIQYSPAAAVDIENCGGPGHLLCFTLASCVAVLAVELSTRADNADGDWEPDSAVDPTSKGKRDRSIPGIYLLCTMQEAPTHYVGIPGNAS
jgi:hypothetical protein